MKYIKSLLTFAIAGIAVVLFATGTVGKEKADSVSVTQYQMVTLDITGMT